MFGFFQGHSPGWRVAVLYGVVGGWMALIRVQDGVFLALPFLAQLPDVWRSLQGIGVAGRWKGWLRDVTIAGLSALLTFSPQIAVWGQLYGDYFRSPYLYQQRITFDWFTPKLVEVLFSAYRGLFTWHPIFLLALMGLLITCRKERGWAWVGFLAFAAQWYLVSSWHNWMQGDAFGGRMFIVCMPVFALGLAHLIEWAQRRWSW